MRAKSRRYQKPLSIKMTRHLHRSLSNPLFPAAGEAVRASL
jgi:hypothetical protein